MYIMDSKGGGGGVRTTADLEPEQIRSDAIRAGTVQSSYRNRIEIAPKTKGQAMNNNLSLFLGSSVIRIFNTLFYRPLYILVVF